MDTEIRTEVVSCRTRSFLLGPISTMLILRLICSVPPQLGRLRNACTMRVDGCGGEGSLPFLEEGCISAVRQ